MITNLLQPCTAFEGFRRLDSGPLREVAIAAKNATERGTEDPVAIYDDASGGVIDVDTRGTAEEIVARLEQRLETSPDSNTGETRGRGRPKLGVVGREVTLLPRHWDWLNTQPGGASVALRKLVEEARRTSGDVDRRRASQEAAYKFMSSIGGDLPGFEEASRALFAWDQSRFADEIAAWPDDVRDHAIKLAFGG